MNVYLTFDVEVWCNGWDQLDANFLTAFERYVYGRSDKGDWALPKTLEILNRHQLQGVFFVEPLFAARFGEKYLAEVVGLIRNAGQDVQLHLHPEWTDEIAPAIIANNQQKRQHLSYYTLEEQTVLLAHGRAMLEAAGSGSVTAFRAGSFASNRDTYTALARNDILIDSSLNRFYAVSGSDLRSTYRFDAPFRLDQVDVFPVTVFHDGLGRERPAQVNGCSFEELRSALRQASACGQTDFVIVSHNFELLKPGRSAPDPIVVRRFERLCAFLAAECEELPTTVYRQLAGRLGPTGRSPDLEVSWAATGIRYAEQLARRVL
jgi:peptidoglycan/xylan/chitin deacetylase (PgdA/CDA1 family)